MSEDLTRDEFEEWLEEHKDEVISGLPLRGAKKPLGAWLAAFYTGLKEHALASESESDEDEDDEDEESGDSLDFSGDDT